MEVGAGEPLDVDEVGGSPKVSIWVLDDGRGGGGDLDVCLVLDALGGVVVPEDGRCGSLGGTKLHLAVTFSQSREMICSVVGLASEGVDTSSYEPAKLIESASLD